MSDTIEDKACKSSIAVVTATLYRNWYTGKVKNSMPEDGERDRIDKVRGDLAIETLTVAKSKGFQIVVVDSGSSKAFLEKIRQIGIKPISAKNKGLSLNRQEGFQKAARLREVKVICWVEPEKVDIIKNTLPQAVIPILNNQADIVIPKRNEQAFNTYPTYQAEIEKRANRAWNNILRKYNVLPIKVSDLDIWFGPKFFKNDPKLIKIFLREYQFKDKIQKLDIWSNAIVFPVITALKKGYKVISVKVAYKHSKKQTAIEENSPLMMKKRQVQYRSILSTTEYFIKNLLNDL